MGSNPILSATFWAGRELDSELVPGRPGKHPRIARKGAVPRTARLISGGSRHV